MFLPQEAGGGTRSLSKMRDDRHNYIILYYPSYGDDSINMCSYSDLRCEVSHALITPLIQWEEGGGREEGGHCAKRPHTLCLSPIRLPAFSVHQSWAEGSVAQNVTQNATERPRLNSHSDFFPI